MTERDVEAVAKGLTKAQRADFLLADSGDAYCPHFSRLYSDNNYELCHLIDAYPAHHDPDCSTDDDGGTRWSFTPLGLAVRAYLMSNESPSHDAE